MESTTITFTADDLRILAAALDAYIRDLGAQIWTDTVGISFGEAAELRGTILDRLEGMKSDDDE